MTLASQSEQVIVLDLNLAKRSMSKQLASELPEDHDLETLLFDEGVGQELLVDVLAGAVVIDNTGEGHLKLSSIQDAKEKRDLLELQKTRYDCVILDTSPMQRVPEARVLARICNLSVLVPRWGKPGAARSPSPPACWAASATAW